MDSNDQVTAMEGQPTSGLHRDTLSTIPDHAKAGTRGTTKLQQQSKSPLEPREDDISVQAMHPVEDQLCTDAEYQYDKEGTILKRSPRGSILGSAEFLPAVPCQQHVEGKQTRRNPTRAVPLCGKFHQLLSQTEGGRNRESKNESRE